MTLQEWSLGGPVLNLRIVCRSEIQDGHHVSYCHHFSSIVNISHFNLLLRNHWANCNQTLMEWSLDGPLPNLCPVIPTSNQDGRQAKNRKKGDEIKKKIFSSETTEPISTKLCWNDSWMAPFQNFVRLSRLPTKMATKLKIEKGGGDEILIVHCCFSAATWQEVV